MKRSIYIGFDHREREAFRVAIRSIHCHLSSRVHINSIALPYLAARGLYTRPTARKDGILFDPISAAPMSTEFAIARFLTPVLAQSGWALFVDGDILARADLIELFDMADPRYAVMCVQHRNGHDLAPVKMDGQPQTIYPRKNWSSVMLFNCDHPAHGSLQFQRARVNELPGRDLHRFAWLDDDLIGELPARWNHLIGVDDHDPSAAVAHFTLGLPDMPGYENSPFAEEWRSWL